MKIVLLLIVLFFVSCTPSIEDRLCEKKCDKAIDRSYLRFLIVHEAEMSRWSNNCICTYRYREGVTEEELCKMKKK